LLFVVATVPLLFLCCSFAVPLLFSFHLFPPLSTSSPPRVSARYGRFTLADPTGVENTQIINPFETYRSIDIMNMTKTKMDNSMPLYKSTPSTITAGKKEGAIIFRFQPTSWHYGWRSSKHMKDSAHVFRTFCFIVSPNRELLKCIAVTETSWFTLASSKRAKNDANNKNNLALLAQQKSELQLASHPKKVPVKAATPPDTSFSNNALSLLAKLAPSSDSLEPMESA